MSVQVKRRRDTANNVAAYTGAQGEIVVDTTNNRVTLHDGSIAGGWPHALETRHVVSDASYTATVTDRLVAYTALTASRTVTLPAAASYASGAKLTVVDESGAASATLTIALQHAGSDTINGGASVAIATRFGSVTLESNGSNAWTVLAPSQPPITAVLALGPNGSQAELVVAEQMVSGLSGTSVTASAQIPAGVLVLAVSSRVVTAITGATSFSVGYTGNATAFGSSLGLSAGSTNEGLIGPNPFYNATSIVLTAAGGNFTAGAVRARRHVSAIRPANFVTTTHGRGGGQCDAHGRRVRAFALDGWRADARQRREARRAGRRERFGRHANLHGGCGRLYAVLVSGHGLSNKIARA